jgi:hypothetical protein
VRPSIQPSARSRSVKAAVHGPQTAESAPKNPMVGSFPACCPPRRDRPRCRRAAEKGDEIAAPHSITSSARPSSVSGTVRPSTLAVLRLRISSTFVDCWTDLSSALDTLDAPYLPLVVQEAVGLPLDPSFAEQKRILERCKGLFYGCADGAEARRFNRLLIDAGLIKGL